MIDFAAMLKKPPESMAHIYLEHTDGTRHRLTKEPVDIKTATEQIKFFAKRWTMEGAKRKAERVDAVSFTLRTTSSGIAPIVKGLPQFDKAKLFYDTVGTLYIDPIIDRSKHAGDIRVDRTKVKRKPIQ